MQLLEGLEGPLKVHPDLPVFRLRRGGTLVYYAPGIVMPVHPDADSAVLAAVSRGAIDDPGLANRAATVLLSEACEVKNRWKQFANRRFSPAVLTLHLSNDCSLDCTYCYSRANRGHGPMLSLDAATKAARLVMTECARKGNEATVVLHGGGEPTIHWDLLLRVIDTINVESQREQVSWHCQMSTNACFEEARVPWLARNIQVISISCDGPHDLQNGQRPFRGGRHSSWIVERNAEALADAGARIEVRCTITPNSIDRQADIVAYAHTHLHASTIRFEPLFQTTEWDEASITENAFRFVRGFLAARRQDGQRGE